LRYGVLELNGATSAALPEAGLAGSIRLSSLNGEQPAVANTHLRAARHFANSHPELQAHLADSEQGGGVDRNCGRRREEGGGSFGKADWEIGLNEKNPPRLVPLQAMLQTQRLEAGSWRLDRFGRRLFSGEKNGGQVFRRCPFPAHPPRIRRKIEQFRIGW